MTEYQHQKAVFDWAKQPEVRQKYPELKLLFHIPNGGRRDPVEAKHLREQGVKKGVPDLFLPVARNGFHGLFIEMKTERGGILGKDQRWWEHELRTNDYCHCWAFGWEAAVATLIDYLDGGS